MGQKKWAGFDDVVRIVKDGGMGLRGWL